MLYTPKQHYPEHNHEGMKRNTEHKPKFMLCAKSAKNGVGKLNIRLARIQERCKTLGFIVVVMGFLQQQKTNLHDGWAEIKGDVYFS